MKFVNLSFSLPKDEVMSVLKNNEFVNENVRFDKIDGKPIMKFKEKGKRLKITCEIIGGPSKDNGFFVGTYFTGRLFEKNGKTYLKGRIITAPIYHVIMLSLFFVFILQCFKMKAFSVVPILLLLFSFYILKDEYKKQGYIRNYLYRAARKAEKMSS